MFCHARARLGASPSSDVPAASLSTRAGRARRGAPGGPLGGGSPLRHRPGPVGLHPPPTGRRPGRHRHCRWQASVSINPQLLTMARHRVSPVIESIGPERPGVLGEGRRRARERAWAKGVAAELITLPLREGGGGGADHPPTPRRRGRRETSTASSASIRCSATWTRALGRWPACRVQATPAPIPRPTISACCTRHCSNCRMRPGGWRSWPEPTPAAPRTASWTCCANRRSASRSASWPCPRAPG
jgi:hypothetical protein